MEAGNPTPDEGITIDVAQRLAAHRPAREVRRAGRVDHHRLGRRARWPSRLTEVQDNEQLGALPAAAEARLAQERIAAAFPEPSALVAVVVYAREAGLTPADRAKVEADRAVFARYAEGGAVPAPTPSEDGEALLVAFALAGDDAAQSAAVEPVKERARRPTRRTACGWL